MEIHVPSGGSCSALIEILAWTFEGGARAATDVSHKLWAVNAMIAAASVNEEGSLDNYDL